MLIALASLLCQKQPEMPTLGPIAQFEEYVISEGTALFR